MQLSCVPSFPSFSHDRFVHWWLHLVSQMAGSPHRAGWQNSPKFLEGKAIFMDRGSFSKVISFQISSTCPSNFKPYHDEVSSSVFTDFSRRGPCVIAAQLQAFGSFHPLWETGMHQMWLFHCLLFRFSLISSCFAIADDISPSLFYIPPECNLKCIGLIYNF